jgi:hypothetical protein
MLSSRVVGTPYKHLECAPDLKVLGRRADSRFIFKSS